jgi:hypothetical protein
MMKQQNFGKFASLGAMTLLGFNLVAPQNAQAIISGVSASTDMGSGFGTNIQNTINGNGLSSLSLTATHDPTSIPNSWVSSSGLTGNITFDLGGQYDLSSLSFWNQNGGGPGSSGSTGIRGVTIQTSNDNVSYTNLAGGPTQFSQVAASGNASPEIFNFTPVQASFVRFQVSSNWGDSDQTGFAEVQFDDSSTAVPFEFSPTLGLLAVGGLIGISHLRKSTKSFKLK